MPFKRQTQLFLIAGLVITGLALTPVVNASSKDTQQPITIEADRAELDEKKEISVYSGNVTLQQGGINIKAEKITVYAQNNQLQRVVAEGNPVQYQQIREDQENIQGFSQRMEYETKTKRFLLLKGAELWQGKNKFSGEQIQFDPEGEKVIATGSPGVSGKPGQRVKITLQPKSEGQNNQKNKDKKQ